MKKKLFLTESDRKQILADKEKAILESFAKTFNKIKRIDENELNEEFDYLGHISSTLSEVVRENDGPNAKSLTLKFKDGSEMFMFQNLRLGKRFHIPKEYDEHRYEAYELYKLLANNVFNYWDVYKHFDNMAIDGDSEENLNEIGLEPQTKDVAYYIKKALEVKPEYDFNVDNISRLSARYRRKEVIDFTATKKFDVSDEDGEYTLLLKISVEHEEDPDGASASTHDFFGFFEVYMEDENNPLYGVVDKNLLVKPVKDDFGIEALPQEIVSKLDPETLKKLEFEFKGFVGSVKDDSNFDY